MSCGNPFASGRARVTSSQHDGRWSFNQNWKLTTLQPNPNLQDRTPRPRLSVPGFVSPYLFSRWWVASDRRYRANVPVDTFVTKVDNIDRVHKISYEDFKEKYEKANKPVIMTGMMDDWPALEGWTRQRLLETYGERLVKTDEPDDYGGKVCVAAEPPAEDEAA